MSAAKEREEQGKRRTNERRKEGQGKRKCEEEKREREATTSGRVYLGAMTRVCIARH